VGIYTERRIDDYYSFDHVEYSDNPFRNSKPGG